MRQNPVVELNMVELMAAAYQNNTEHYTLLIGQQNEPVKLPIYQSSNYFVKLLRFR